MPPKQLESRVPESSAHSWSRPRFKDGAFTQEQSHSLTQNQTSPALETGKERGKWVWICWPFNPVI